MQQTKRKCKPFVDLERPVFKNKSNGQITITLPKGKLKKIGDVKSAPATLSIRIFRW